MATTQQGTSGSSGMQRGSGSGMQSGTGMQTGSGRFGRQRTPDDATYDLISVMYHALQGCEQYEQYARDADQAGQQEIAQFFRDAVQQNERLAQRGQQLLAQCLQQGQGGGRSGQQLQQGGNASSQQGGMSGGSLTGSSGMSGGSTGGSASNTSRSGSGTSRGGGAA